MSDELAAANNAARHRFEVTMGADVAFTEYRIEGPDIVLPHTVVLDPSGRVVASRVGAYPESELEPIIGAITSK